MRIITVLTFLLFVTAISAQKQPLNHTVYDGWQAIGERLVSNNGQFIAFTVNPQEGDGSLIIKTAAGDSKATVARGYGASMTDDNRFLICKIKPYFNETREARIKKKKPEDMPKDSMAIVELANGKITKTARVKSFKLADENATVLAYLLEKALPEAKPKATMDSVKRISAMVTMADSLMRMSDSIRNKANDAKLKGISVLEITGNPRPALPKAPEEPFEEGTMLMVKNLVTGEETGYMLVSEYFYNKKGNVLVMETTKKTGDAKIKPAVMKLNIVSGKTATLLVGFNDAKGYKFDENGAQLAFVAERDSSIKSLQKFYKLYYHSEGADSATMIAGINTAGMPAGSTVGEFTTINFSKTGNRLFFGTAPVLPVKDTITPDFERVSVDVWGQKDDYLQPMQLKNLESDLRRSHLARYDFKTKSLVQLSTAAFGRGVQQTAEGDGQYFYASADEGNRIATQWQGFALNDLYVINPETGNKKLILKNFKGNAMPSSTGKYLLMYDEKKRSYSAYNAATQQTAALGKDIKLALYDEENDVPDDPNAYGIAGWMENDEEVLVYDMYDIWKLDPNGIKASVNLTNGLGRKNKLSFRNIVLDREEKFIKKGQQLLLSVFNNTNKGSGLKYYTEGEPFVLAAGVPVTHPVRIAGTVKAKEAMVLSYSTETYQRSADIRVSANTDLGGMMAAASLHQPNPQQNNYNWGTAELFKWKAYTGKETEGVLYKPENFDATKKYPMIVYFYERNAATLYNYNAPSPTPSRLNIPFFVSRGYIVFVPDIWYKTGYPGQGAYDYILSGTRAVVQKGFVDSTKIGLQGQSWGGFQIVYLITKTNLYAAAWAGAPVANMTSAYGGIRWGSGMNRQFQYEKTQSRIGATLWEKPNLYLDNSALFSLPKVKTPLVIMHNDADDAVPWYQGIEMYTGMRRLGKQVWMLNYNNEAHNLIERRNRKDIQIREQQFFDYLLKGDKPAKWITDGVPAVMKGRDWGLGY